MRWITAAHRSTMRLKGPAVREGPGSGGLQATATGGTTYSFGTAANPGYVYNLAGEMTTENYPSGRQVTFS